MAKVPLPGTVKTRLQPFLTADGCASLATALLCDTEQKASTSGFETVFAVSPPEKLESMSRLLPRQRRLIGQSGLTLGERMHNAFLDVLAGGTEAAVMIGADCPSMPAEYIGNAFQLLKEGSEAVIGPSEDGGFYLIGLRSANSEIFKRVDWSTPRAFTHTFQNLVRIGIKPALLPVCYDVDAEADLRRLFSERELLTETASHTFEWLNSNAHLFKARS